MDAKPDIRGKSVKEKHTHTHTYKEKEWKENEIPFNLVRMV